jgi:hypothetical protein
MERLRRARKFSLKDLVARPEKTEPLPVCVDADVLIAGPLSHHRRQPRDLVLDEVGLLRLVLPKAAVAEVRRNLAASFLRTSFASATSRPALRDPRRSERRRSADSGDA